MDEWAQFDQSIVDAAISQWRRRLRACVAGHTWNINFDNFELNYNTILQFCLIKHVLVYFVLLQ